MMNRKFYLDEKGNLIMEDWGCDGSVEYTAFDIDDICKIRAVIEEKGLGD